MPLLSIIIPAYNEEESLTHVAPAIHDVLDDENISFEIIFIDDGSTDRTYMRIKELSRESDNIHGYKFSRNFGKEAAIWAGLQKINGDVCVVMDCDLQHPPSAIPKMYRAWESGYEVVEGVKSHRGSESAVYKFFSKAFYRIMASISGFDMKTSSDFKLLDKRVVNELLELKERNAFFRGLSFWVGFNSTQVEYEVAPRVYGTTKWSVVSLAKYALSNIVGFSTAPMQLVTVIGIALLIASFGVMIHTIISYFAGHSLEGFTTIILLLLLIGGGLMISLGIIGVYIAKIYDEVKSRPRFIISESTD